MWGTFSQSQTTLPWTGRLKELVQVEKHPRPEQCAELAGTGPEEGGGGEGAVSRPIPLRGGGRDRKINAFSEGGLLSWEGSERLKGRGWEVNFLMNRACRLLWFRILWLFSFTLNCTNAFVTPLILSSSQNKIKFFRRCYSPILISPSHFLTERTRKIQEPWENLYLLIKSQIDRHLWGPPISL